MLLLFPGIVAEQVKQPHSPEGIKAAALQLYRAFAQRRLRAETGIACRGEISLICLIGTFTEFNILNRFRYQKVQVLIPLPMCVRYHIDWHAIHRQPDVGAVVNVEAAQEDLLCLAAAGMLCNKKSWYQPQHIL